MKTSPTTDVPEPNKFIRLNSYLNLTAMTPSPHTEQLATTERIPTTTWGPFTLFVVVTLVLLTCFILNCKRIRRKVDETKMHRSGKTGSFSFENRHKQLQEADLEWNIHPPIVYTQPPESSHSSLHSKNSACSGWSSNNSTIAQSHHYHDLEFIKSQPPGVQLRLALESASIHSTPTLLKNV
ncbi:hypothetical protein A0J61_08955 [Choanephora cucurbitarum]|uniref:Uncharacterized protein n=1 Tax=Choanephora cucurbitarum TaxID=101091 RepID=A0A1C7N1Y4_9FUNG|nr:hypothetical protein A0J61_08955 [Choanephora cucurbitarum]